MSVSQELTPVSFLRFDGGKNTRFSPLSLEENEVFDLENFHIEPRGGLEKRAGYRFLFAGDTATTLAINGLFYFKSFSSVIKVEGGDIEWNTGAGWNDISAALTISADPDALMVFTEFKKTIVGTNGVNIPIKWAGAGNATIITQAIGATGNNITTARVCVRHRERVILGDVTTNEAGNPRYESRLWPSAVGTVDTWHSSFTDGKIIDVDEGDGDSITALVDVQGYLVVFKQNSLHRVNDFGLLGVQQRVKVANVGTPGPHSVCVVGNIVFFLDKIGQLWAYDATGTNEDKVVNLSERKLGKATLNLINKTRLKQAHLWHDPLRNEIRYWYTSLGATKTDGVGTFNLISGGFAKLVYTDHMNISARYEDSTGEVRCIVGTNNGEVFLLDEGVQDNNVVYKAFVVTRWLDLGDSGVIKGTRRMHLYGTVINSQALSVEHRVKLQGAGTNYVIQLNGPGTALDSFVLDVDMLGGSGDSITKLRAEAHSRWHQFKISQAVAHDLRFIGFVLFVVTAGREQDAA